MHSACRRFGARIARGSAQMFRSLCLGRIRGIDVNVHPSFGLVFVWVFIEWGFGNGGGLTPVFLGCLFVVLIFVSVLIHELGHCAMAVQFGNRVLDITLWPFGGVARIEQMPSEPKSEILISLAGPAMTLAIVVALLPLLLFVAVIGGWEALVPDSGFFDRITPLDLLVYLAATNAFLLAFNLLPAFPMDGGRVLRAALSPALGRQRATTAAVWVGMGFGAAMIVAGLWFRLYTLIIFALFLMLAAQAEGRTVRVESAMRRLTVGQFALWDMGGVSPHQPLTFALRGGPRDLVVTDNGKVVGMLWRAQLLNGLNGGVAGRTVGDVMDRHVYVADMSDSVYDVQRVMNRLDRWAVPVTEDGLYRGIFTADRFVHLYRQIAPNPFRVDLRELDSWRAAIADSVRSWQRQR
jgi:Zn-dependent protease